MQKRHTDRALYFRELTNTSRDFYLDFVRSEKQLSPETRVLEIGCGEGGNLLPFAEIGCKVTGIDIDGTRIDNAIRFFSDAGCNGTFTVSDFKAVSIPQDEDQKFDVVLLHDVIEHIEPEMKNSFLTHAAHFMKQDAILFVGFPAWQMPFGGHQQICHCWVSKIPFIHLLPVSLYRWLLKKAGETDGTIKELLSIKRSKMPVERFERLVRACGMQRNRRILWLINPHYRQKFGLQPHRIVCPFDRIPWLRNFYSTSVWYILKVNQ
ncbi:MAG: class I SAM-dependent methyltransferase [Bacteroidales bacterium]|nr:class I SAM-dependent methyltransferase [Bacteroidales bacterium]